MFETYFRDEWVISAFYAPPGGVATVEAGALTGYLEVLTRLTPDERAVEARVRRAGGRGAYAVYGSPVRAVSGDLGREEHRAAHGRILAALTTPGGAGDGDPPGASLEDL